jgi:hypothetical protein
VDVNPAFSSMAAAALEQLSGPSEAVVVAAVVAWPGDCHRRQGRQQQGQKQEQQWWNWGSGGTTVVAMYSLLSLCLFLFFWSGSQDGHAVLLFAWYINVTWWHKPCTWAGHDSSKGSFANERWLICKWDATHLQMSMVLICKWVKTHFLQMSTHL